MKTILLNRGEGKTSQLIKLSAEKQIPIVTSGNIRYILDMAHKNYFNIPKPIKINKIEDLNKLQGIKEILIDEAEIFLNTILPTRVNTISVSKEEKLRKIKSPYKDTEEEIQEALCKAWNLFVKLERIHPDEIDDFRKGIHECQYCLAMRTVRRDYPDEYPTYKTK